MSLMDFFKKFSIVIFVVLALIVSRMGISYLTILVLIGLLVSFINQRKREAIITGVLYALISYILSYPAGLFLYEYMPSTSLDVSASGFTIMTDLLIGALVPSIVAIVICGICAIIGSEISRYVFKEEVNTNEDGYYFNTDDTIEIKEDNENLSDNLTNNIEYTNYENKNKKEYNNKDLFLNPIQKAKIRRKKEKK